MRRMVATAGGRSRARATSPTTCRTNQRFVDGPAIGVPGVVDPNPFPFSNVENAGFADLTDWIGRKPTPSPHADRIEVTSTTPPTVERDAFGETRCRRSIGAMATTCRRSRPRAVAWCGKASGSVPTPSA
jgi:hypothetical protein